MQTLVPLKERSLEQGLWQVMIHTRVFGKFNARATFAKCSTNEKELLTLI